MAKSDNKSRIDELGKLLSKYRDAYYNGQPLVSDAAYDALEDELRALDPQHPVLASIGAPTAATEWEKARHTIPMGSLNKAVNEAEVRKWAARCDELATAEKLEPISDDLFVTEKLDGISLNVMYENGVFAEAITRGDGEIGERITANVRRMKGVPPKLSKRVSVSVRGEIILKLSDLKKAFPQASNPRNMAAGTSKRFDGQGCEHLSVIFYDLEGEDFPTETKKFERLAALGLDVPDYETTDLDGVIALHKKYSQQKRAKLDYEIDGLVVRANDLRTQHLLGEKAHRPRAAVAFKFASQAKVSKVVAITWETGSSGRVSPVAQIEPVELAGAVVQRASLHNAGNVRELGIGVGDEVLVSRRNDVIPYVEEVVTSRGKAATIPTTCAACAGKLTISGEYLSCRNNKCRALVEGRIQNWVDAQGILEWGEKLIAQLVEAKLVKEPADLYRLTVDDIAGLERRGEVIAKKVLDNLKAKLPLSLPTFLASLGIENFGLQTAKLLLGAGFDTLDKVRAATVEELAQIPSMGQAKARFVVEGLADRDKEIDRLLKAGVVPVALSAGGPLAGKSFCFTGTLSRPRKELEELVEKLGGTLSSGVTKGLSYLVMADPDSGSSKAEKARKYGTECLDEDGFLRLVEAAKKAKK
jgi:DNA ligase (NAD+)